MIARFLNNKSIQVFFIEMQFEYDPQDLIKEVQKRPALWNYDHPDYRSKSAKMKLWREVVKELLKSDEVNMSKGDMREIELQLQKKWKGVRDCFTRHLSRPNRSKRPYLYTAQLQFLLQEKKPKKSRKKNDDDDTSSDSGEEEEGEPTPHSVWRPRKKIKIWKNEESTDNGTAYGTQDNANEDSDSKPDTPEAKSSQYDTQQFSFANVETLLKGESGDPDKLFLLSLLPDLKSIPEGYRLNAKMEIMKVLHQANSEITKMMQGS